ncbi:MAG: hypothetical protein WCR55_07415 [Lentisphaerota bacterium]
MPNEEKTSPPTAPQNQNNTYERPASSPNQHMTKGETINKPRLLL